MSNAALKIFWSIYTHARTNIRSWGSSMRNSLKRTLVVLIGLAAAPFATGHHSVSGQFDVAKTMVLEGTVKRVDWVNPHIYIHLDVTHAGKGAGLLAGAALFGLYGLGLLLLGLAGVIAIWLSWWAGLLIVAGVLFVVAAILTVMGFSMNDTVVVFDRIRENRGKYGKMTRQVVNDSINQTLSRTLLTVGTTIMTIFLMYVMGGPGIHGFTFAMLVGIVTGTYSSIAIASPLLLWGQSLREDVPAVTPAPA